MNEIDDLLRETAARMFGEMCDRALIERAEDGEWPVALWETVQGAGLADAVDPEGDGRALLALPTLAIIVRAAGEFAVPLPLAETFLAQRLLAQVGLEIPQGPLTVAPHVSAILRRQGDQWLVSGQLRRVPWGRHARTIVFEASHEGASALVCLQGLAPTRLGVNLANEPRDDYSIVELPVRAAWVAQHLSVANSVAAEGALFRALQMAGAMGRILGMTVQYSMERVQFGRAIAKFQAIQHQVATMATHAAAAAAAAEAATNAAGQRAAQFEIMAAKLRTSEAAGVCCRVAHQVHGAMGFTHEHALHTFTRRLMSWRDEFGSEAQCGEWIGEQVQRVGGARLWSYVSTPDLYGTQARDGERADA